MAAEEGGVVLEALLVGNHHVGLWRVAAVVGLGGAAAEFAEMGIGGGIHGLKKKKKKRKEWNGTEELLGWVGLGLKLGFL